jgi:hypothetical protein
MHLLPSGRQGQFRGVAEGDRTAEDRIRCLEDITQGGKIGSCFGSQGGGRRTVVLVAGGDPMGTIVLDGKVEIGAEEECRWGQRRALLLSM